MSFYEIKYSKSKMVNKFICNNAIEIRDQTILNIFFIYSNKKLNMFK